MSWHQLSTNTQIIERLYGDAPPALRGWWLSGLALEETNGGRLGLVLSSKQMPERHRWPSEWWSESNRVILVLSFIGLSAVDVEGWTVDNRVKDIDIARADDGRSVELKLSGAWGHVTAQSDAMKIRVDARKVVIEDPRDPYGH